MKPGMKRALILGATMILATPVVAQGLYVYPSKGQSPEQQSRDTFECHQWAVQQTGVDPTRGGAGAPPPQQQQSGGVLRGAAGGAALGAVGGAIGGNAGKGAAIGAGVGALFGGMRQNRQRKQQAAAQQQAQAQQQSAINAYNRAKATCLSGRGYQVQ